MDTPTRVAPWRAGRGVEWSGVVVVMRQHEQEVLKKEEGGGKKGE